MSLNRTLRRLCLAGLLLGSLGACTVVPAHPVGHYRAPAVYVEPYPVYTPAPPRYYYDGYGHRHGHRHRRHWGD